MYGKDVTVNGITVWVCGVPSMTEAEWVKKAKQTIRAKLTATNR